MIGIIDSGVGGLSVYLPLRSRLESADFLYLADSAFAPYGTKSAREITERMERITEWFQSEGVRLLVIACNTATVNAIDELRRTFRDGATSEVFGSEAEGLLRSEGGAIEFIGVEPAIKPAAEHCDRIIVLATESTVQNERYHALVQREAGEKKVWHEGANDLVAQVEAGRLQDTLSLERHLSLPSREADAVVIGCTHFSFLRPTIEQRWPDLQIFDGADGVVRRTVERARALSLDRGEGRSLFCTTGPDRTVSFIHPPIHLRHIDLK